MANKSFEFISGAECLDLANTIGGARGQTNEIEYLESYQDLLNWGRLKGLLSERQAASLELKSKDHQYEANEVLEKTKELRKSIYHIFSAFASGQIPSDSDLLVINRELEHGLHRQRIVWGSSGYEWGWEEPTELDSLLAPIARSAADLITSADLTHVKECTSPSCSWLFVDETKNQSRRWCNMKTCGNRNKLQRFRSRQIRHEQK
ncbi:hypothetical protein E4665_15020 [Sporolactobacillus shoreae]|uniref:Zinc finger CGNR domain-containing protein n=1 Tax=Sporolactobacillus shoreae TaxID=1465501 RepID=A0A4Z0GKU4_9BACL|nr:ABATE domain-containing protein [Sporolactobacillus shoreae]TGA96606.1 hypothetical protein E4665_15020 [Sporolactobacillus shoreae]